MILKLALSLLLVLSGSVLIVREVFFTQFVTEPPPLEQTRQIDKEIEPAEPDFEALDEEAVSTAAAITQVFTDLNYAGLSDYLAERVAYYTFGSSHIVMLNRADLIDEVTLRANEATVWITDQDHPEIVFTKQDNPNWHDSFVVLGDHNSAFVFTFNDDQQIESVAETYRYYLIDQPQ